MAKNRSKDWEERDNWKAFSKAREEETVAKHTNEILTLAW